VPTCVDPATRWPVPGALSRALAKEGRSGGRSGGGIWPHKKNPIHKIQKLLVKEPSRDSNSSSTPSSPRSVCYAEEPPSKQSEQLPSLPPSCIEVTPASIAEAPPCAPVVTPAAVVTPAVEVRDEAADEAVLQSTANALVHDALQAAVAAHEAEVLDDFARGWVAYALERAVDEVARPPPKCGIADVSRAASVASKSGRLWGLVATLTDKMSLMDYEQERETAQENPFRWF